MKLLCIIVSAAFFTSIFGQVQYHSASTALNQFALNFLAETCSHTDSRVNVALSPYTVWSVMAIINEGASANTERQLERTLGIPPNGVAREYFRTLQQNLVQNIMKNHDGVSLEILNAVFTRLEKRLNQVYQQLVRKLYNVDVLRLDFNDAYNASLFINEKLANATRGRLSNFIREGDLQEAQMFITSALFFKGFWDVKFNKSATHEQPFHNGKNEFIGKVKMMFVRAFFPYSLILNQDATAVELPYQENRMSMIVVLPKPKVSLQTVINKLAEQPFTVILDALKQSTEQFGIEEINVFLPKFKITSDLNLNSILDHMGMKDVFNSADADLSGISPDKMFVSRVIHKAEIEVDEDGTVASSVSLGEIQNKIPPPNFVADRPFVFFIFDKQTQSVVFAGRYSYPK